jgi:hypothetical protein
MLISRLATPFSTLSPDIDKPGETIKLYSTPIAGGFVEARVDPVS